MVKAYTTAAVLTCHIKTTTIIGHIKATIIGIERTIITTSISIITNCQYYHANLQLIAMLQHKN